MAPFIEELKRRNVIRAGIAYLAVAWLLLQVAETLLPVYGFSDAAIRNAVAFLAIGFFVTIAFSWAYEWTPAGILRDSGVAAPSAEASAKGRGVDRFIILTLAAALAFFAVDKFVLDPARDARKIEAASQLARSQALSTADRDRSVAVLPFVNRSNRDDDVYFADGIHADILTHLARIEALKVTSRTSVEQYRGGTRSIRDIAVELDVRAVLEGSVRRAGDRVRINVQLVDAESDVQLWAESYDRELTAADVFSVQADIAAAVAEQLRATLLPTEQQALRRELTENYQAYDLYLLGRYYLEQRTKESVDLARDYFEQSVAQDSEFVRALSGLAESLMFQVDYGTLTGDIAYREAARVIDRAMAIDDASSEVWTSRGYLRHVQNDLGQAADAYRTALNLDAENSSAWFRYSILLWRQYRYSDALDGFETAHILEPMSRVINSNLGNAYLLMGNFELARKHLFLADQVDSAQALTQANRVFESYHVSSELARTVKVLRDELQKDPENLQAIDWLVLTYIALGEIDEAAVWDERRASLNSQHILTGYRIAKARRDYRGAIANREDLLNRLAPQRPRFVLLSLFLTHIQAGDPAAARRYLTEVLEITQGQIEIAPRETQQLNNLIIAAYWIAYGDAEFGEPARGRALATEIRDRMTALKEASWRHPTMFVSLAGAHALLGDERLATDSLLEAIENGYRDQPQVLDHLIFDSLRDSPEFSAARDRIDLYVAKERERLNEMELAAYTLPVQREAIKLPPETLDRYFGWYSDGNTLVHAYASEDDRLFFRRGQEEPREFVAFSDTEFFVPTENFYTTRVETDVDGFATHFIVSGAFGEILHKRVPDPLPTIELPRESLARFEGSYSHDQLSGLDSERADSDIFGADIYVDADANTWLDFDNQPKLKIRPISDAKFDVIGVNSVLEFGIDPATDRVDHFTMTQDGREYRFQRE